MSRSFTHTVPTPAWRKALKLRSVKVMLSLALALALTGTIGASASPSRQAASAGPFGFDVLVGAWERPGFAPSTVARTSVFALSGPMGERAVGAFSAQNVVGGVSFPYSGRVTCLRVDGNRAVAGGVVMKSEAPNAPVGSGFLMQVTDNGFPGAGRDTNINFGGFGGSDPELTTCPFTDDVTEITLAKGDLAVHDG
jgi:hypothetical protein